MISAIVTLFCLHSGSAWAYTELSLSANLRNSTLTTDIYSRTISVTGGVSFYFMEMSAIEISYTQGSRRDSFVETGSTDPKIIRSVQEVMGVDFILSMAGREAPLQPYVKVGVAKISNKQYLQAPGFSENETAVAEGTAPSAGVGLRILITKTFSIKMGIDAWQSPVAKTPGSTAETERTYDYSGRVGVSWML
jgi:hypothetical protein